jgi:hypothetical protein
VTQVTGNSIPTGSAGSFDGSDDKMVKSAEESAYFENALTWEAWIKPNGTDSDEQIFTTFNTTNTEGWDFQKRRDNSYRLVAANGSGGFDPVISTTAPNVGTYQHVVVTWDKSANEMEIAVNGTVENTVTLSFTPAPGTNDLGLGNRSDGSGSFLEADLSVARAWNGRALTSSEISTLYNSGNGLSLSEIESSHPGLLDDLVASYEFDDANDLGNDSFVLDGPVVRVRRDSDNVEREVGFDGDTVDTQALTDFANGGDVYVVTWYDQESNRDFSQTTQSEQPIIVDNGTVVSGNASSGMEYDGSDDNLALSESIVGGLQEATIMVWIKVISKTNDFPSVLLDGESGKKENMNMFVDLTNDKWGYNAEDGNQVIFDERATPYSTGQWFHIAFAYDPDDKAEFFINGTKQASTTPSITFSTIRENTKEVRIANRLNGVEDENNAVYEDVIFFDKALTESEVQSIYDKTK